MPDRISKPAFQRLNRMLLSQVVGFTHHVFIGTPFAPLGYVGGQKPETKEASRR
jgi:hypothetical protein